MCCAVQLFSCTIVWHADPCLMTEAHQMRRDLACDWAVGLSVVKRALGPWGERERARLTGTDDEPCLHILSHQCFSIVAFSFRF